MANATASLFGPAGKAMADSSGKGKNKVQTIQDPLAQQKTAAANLGLQNYQTASGNVPALQSYFDNNFGQTPQTTLNNEDPLSQDVYRAVQGDITGAGGPFTSLKNNLLGSFDTQATRSMADIKNQLQKEGLLTSGPGFQVQGTEAGNLAQQRAGISSQTDVNELNMANQLGQQLMQNNQLMGYTNPMMALSQIQSLASPPSFQNLDNTMYQQPSFMSQIAPLLGQLGGAAVGGMVGGPAGAGVGSSLGGSVGGTLGGGQAGSQFYTPFNSQNIDLSKYGYNPYLK